MLCVLQTVSLPVTEHAYPFTSTSGNIFLAAAGVTIDSREHSLLYEVNQIDPNNNDFFSK